MKYECHITIEPVFEERFNHFEKLCNELEFRPAKLLMQKTRSETGERSNKDSFCTGHSNDYMDIHTRMHTLRKNLQAQGFKVWRYKIEQILLDVRCV